MAPSGVTFQSLEPLDVESEQARNAQLPLDADGLAHGVLSGNRLTYYVKKNRRPSQRAALALVVNIGSVVEEESERGCAHICEHLAFNATKNYSNHDIVKFLETIGAPFGACQNAYTSADETVFELFIPIDKPGLLSKALSVLAEFSVEIRISEADLAKERGVVLEEWRQHRDATGRMQEAYWALLTKGSRYAERLPIGTEHIIKSVPAAVVQAFYRRWYRPEHMAVVAVGDFEDVQGVVRIIAEHFGEKAAFPPPPGQSPPSIPKFGFTPHSELRVSTFADSESTSSAVLVSCKLPEQRIDTVAQYQDFLAHEMAHMAINQRLFKISRQNPPPFYSCESGGQTIARTIESVTISASCQEGGTLPALRAMLTELARIRVHGFSAREVAVVRRLYLADMERAYIERDQALSDGLRAEYVQHFLTGEPVPGIVYEARLAKTLLPLITAEDMQAVAHAYRTHNSCVIKTVEHRARTSEAAVRAVVAEVEAAEAGGAISPWDDGDRPESLVSVPPTPGSVTSRREYPKLGGTELTLSNGMRVFLKKTDLRDDQVLIGGFAYGGLSEIAPEDYHSVSMAATIAGELGVYGVKPVALMELLAGVRAEVGQSVSAYQRGVAGEASPADLEAALQLVYQLFVTAPRPTHPDELDTVMRMTREAVKAQLRDPFTAFSNKVRALNYGDSYFFRPMTDADIDAVDPVKACQAFSAAFQDPASFTFVLVGTLDEAAALPLVLQYLGGIPEPSPPPPRFERDTLTQLPFKFPEGVIREEVPQVMTAAQSTCQITFPVVLPGAAVSHEVHWTMFAAMLLEQAIMRVLRFKHGQIYTVSVSPYLGGSRPSRSGGLRGDLAVSFSCDPDASWTLVDLALAEVARLQQEGPSAEDCATLLELERRAHELSLQENASHRDFVLRAYQTRFYTGDLDAAHETTEAIRAEVLAALTPETLLAALRRVLPFPASSQYTAVVLIPRPPLWRRLFSPSAPEGRLVLLAGVLVATTLLWRAYRH